MVMENLLKSIFNIDHPYVHRDCNSCLEAMQLICLCAYLLHECECRKVMESEISDYGNEV